MEFNRIDYNTLPSTNAEAVRLYKLGTITSATVITAVIQTNGKGYGSNYWESEPGKNLTFSMVCFPKEVDPSKQFILTQIISMALLETVSKIITSKPVTVKWPNDLYVGNKKIAGVLIQNFVKGSAIDVSIIGVGLNINQKVFTSNAPNPTSIINETGNEFAPDVLLSQISQRFGFYLEHLSTSSVIESVTENYMQHLYRLGQRGKYKDKNGPFTASIAGIDNYGRLILQHENGNKQTYGFKEVEFM